MNNGGPSFSRPSPQPSASQYGRFPRSSAPGIKTELGLSESQFGLLVATPILMGSVSRIFLGIRTEQFGGRLMFPLKMLITSLCVWLMTSAQWYPVFLLAALGLGLAGGSFIIGSPTRSAGSRPNVRARRSE